jgi:hypothetical protein
MDPEYNTTQTKTSHIKCLDTHIGPIGRRIISSDGEDALNCLQGKAIFIWLVADDFRVTF